MLIYYANFDVTHQYYDDSFIEYLYRDETGYIIGWSKELIDHVCRAANIDCRIVWDKWSNCFKSDAGQPGGVGGRG